MKNWLGAVGRSTAAFCIILILLASAAALSRDAEAASRLPFLPTFLASLSTIFPFAVAAAVFLGFFIFEGKCRVRLLSWASLLFLGCLFAAGGAGLRALHLESQAKPQALAPVAGRAVVAGNQLCYVRYYEKGEAVEAVGYDFQSKALPRLAYAPRTAAPGQDGGISVEGGHYSLRPGRLGAQARLLPFGPSATDLAARLAAIDRLPRLEGLIAMLGFVLLATGLASLTRFPRWPLVGFFLSCAGFCLLVFLDIALASPELAPPLRAFAARASLGSWPLPRIEAAIEGLLGLVAGIAGLAAPKRGEA
jgi:hypothetical protein